MCTPTHDHFACFGFIYADIKVKARQIKSSMNSKANDDDLICYWENNL